MTNELTVLRVAVPVPVDGGLDYIAPDGVKPARGCRVVVPVGRRTHVGIVLGQSTDTAVERSRLKSIAGVLDREPVIDASLLAALEWCAAYYHYPLGEVISVALPSLLRQARSARRELPVSWALSAEGRAKDTVALARRARRQARVLEQLAERDSEREPVLLELGFTRAELGRLARKGWLRRIEQQPNADSETSTPLQPLPTLTPTQRDVLAAIDARSDGYNAFLLHGVTGSGKTEIYMRLIADRLAQSRQSLLLVPEISLTPQLVARLEARFGQQLAVMHSGLTDRERLAAWQHCREGTRRVVVGTRSAVFAPLHSPGLLIVDEEHDASFKQAEGFRYSARDLAVYRARQLDIPVILGSATPSLESYQNAGVGRYTLLRLAERIGAAGTPSLRIIDLNRHAERDGLSTPLIEAIEKHLDAGQQILLFLNRRGFAPALFCPDCCEAEQCARCDARMTVHATGGRLSCHHCGAERALSWACPNCGRERIAVGAGTQRVGESLRALFPHARVGRLDRDATAQRGSLAKVLADVEAGSIQILVGTQMLAKGHDFPNVTLVGVLNADQGLFGTDFRSTERLAQTIVQVAGRAGRAERPGEVLVQTHYPGHPLFEHLRDQDYVGFTDEALEERRASGWPPFSHLVVVRAQAPQRGPVFAFLRKLARSAHSGDSTITVHGPAPAAMERLSGRYRGQLLLQSSSRGALHASIAALLPTVRRWPEARKVRWSLDVDPTEL